MKPGEVRGVAVMDLPPLGRKQYVWSRKVPPLTLTVNSFLLFCLNRLKLPRR